MPKRGRSLFEPFLTRKRISLLEAKRTITTTIIAGESI